MKESQQVEWKASGVTTTSSGSAVGDQGRYPERLEDLIETGYLRQIPRDPLTRSAATWVPVYAQDQATGRQAIVDVRAGKADWLDRLRTLF